MHECFHCFEKAVIWDGDFDSEDYGYSQGGIIRVGHCTNCGAEIQCLIWPGGVFRPEDETDVRKFDVVERYNNCTVEILRDSETGAESTGWWKNTEVEE